MSVVVRKATGGGEKDPSGERDQRTTVEILQGGPEIIDGLADEWRSLCDAPGNLMPFNRPEWVKAYFRNNDNARFLIFSVRVDGKMKALLPLIEMKTKRSFFSVNVLRGPSDFNLWPTDVVMSPDSDRRAISSALWDQMAKTGSWDTVVLPNLPEGGVIEDLLTFAERDGFLTQRWEYMHSPNIKLSDWAGEKDPIRIADNPKLRKNIRQTLRKIQNDGGLKVRHYNHADPDILRRLYELESAGWKGEQGTAIASREKDVRFINEIAGAAQHFGYLLLSTLEFDGNLIGIALGFLYKNSYFGLKLGWDERYRHYSLGHLIVHATLAECLQKGINDYNMLGLGSSWKERWTKSAYRYSNLYIFRKGMRGKLLHFLNKIELSRIEKTFVNKVEHIGAPRDDVSGQDTHG